MLMTNLNLKSLLVALVCCLFNLSASAQEDSAYDLPEPELNISALTVVAEKAVAITQMVNDAYKANEVSVDLSGAAELLGTTDETLEGAIDQILYGVNGDSLTNDYTAGAPGFWFNCLGTEETPTDECVVGSWGGDGCAFFAEAFAYDVESKTLTANLGMFPGQAESVRYADVYLVVGSKAVKVRLTLTIVPRPTVDLPEPELQVSKLTVVAEKEFAITQIANNVYKADQVIVDLGGVAELLGTTDEILEVAIDQILYGVKADWEFADQKADSLTNAFTAGAPGFWFNRLGDGESYVTDECVVGNYGGTGCAFFAEAFEYDAANNTLTANLGMFPGLTEVTRYADVYLVVGNKAAKVRLTLTVEPIPTLPLAQMTKVGETTVEVQRAAELGYGASTFHVDADAIAALLECDPDDLEMMLLASDEENLQNWGDTDGWMTETGTATNWGNNSALCIKYQSADNTAGNYGNFWMCTFPGGVEDGAVYTTPVYLKYQNSYYVVTIVTTIKDQEINPDDYVSVAERNIAIKANNLGEYEIPSKASIPLNDLETLLGTTSPTLYGQKKTEDGFSYSNSYTCDPAPGFWMTNDGYTSTWGSANTDWGVTYASNGTFTFWQMPNQLVVGQVYAGTVYLRNDETGKMITVNLSVTCTDEYIAPDVKLEQVGSESVAVGMETVNNATSGELELDLTKMIEALELSADEDDLYDFFSSGSKCLVGENASGEWAAPTSIEDGQYFDVQGKVVADINDYNFQVYLEYNGGETAMLYVDGVDPVAEGEAVTLKIGFVNGNNVYAFYVTLMNEEDLTGISTAKVTNADGQIYDLSGRKVVKAQKGVYIQNGKKFVVK